MFQAPLADSFLIHAPAYVGELISEESLKQTGYFDVAQVRHDCELVATQGSSQRLGKFGSLGLGGVVATQLWHHLYLGGRLCSLPTRDDTGIAAGRVSEPNGRLGALSGIERNH
jgi:asparagine synthase (glutamine-hydrolysing)